MGNTCTYSNPKIRAAGIIGIYDISKISKGVLCTRLGEITDQMLNESILVFQAQLLKSPEDFFANLHLGICLFKLGFFEISESHLLTALKADDNFSAYYVLALIYVNKSRMEDAVRCLKKVVELKEDFLPGYLKLIEVYLRLACYTEVKGLLRVAKRLERFNSELLMMTGLYYKGKERLEKAKNYLTKALVDSEDLGRCYFYLGEISHLQGLCTEALMCYHNALDSSKGNIIGMIKISQAILHFDMENFDLMLKAIKDSLQSGPVLYNYKGFTVQSPDLVSSIRYYIMQNYSDSIKILKTLFRTNRKNLVAGYFLAISYKSRGNSKKTLHYFKKIIRHGFKDTSQLSQIIIKKALQELEKDEEKKDLEYKKDLEFKKEAEPEDTFECIESPMMNKNSIPEFVIRYHKFSSKTHVKRSLSVSTDKQVKIPLRAITPTRSVIEKFSKSSNANTEGCTIY